MSAWVAGGEQAWARKLNKACLNLDLLTTWQGGSKCARRCLHSSVGGPNLEQLQIVGTSPSLGSALLALLQMLPRAWKA